MPSVIPVSIVTGFLGSGKTTLIGRILRDPAFARTAVIVNEFGEIGLDHDLIASSDESLMTLTTGCLCCAVQGDLVRTLLDLRANQAAAYDRVLIETSGLADPAPILHALMTDATLARDHVIDTTVTVIDPVHGLTTLDAHPEARRQAALADVLAISKLDVAPITQALADRVTAINPTADQIDAHALPPERLFGAGDAERRIARMTRLPDRAGTSPFATARHTDAIETFAIVRDRPIPALALTFLIQALTEHCGARLLRMKGIIAIEEAMDRPAVIHGVRHVFAAPEFLPAWPNDDRTSRIVFIAQGVPRYLPARLLDIIEHEVRDEVART